MSLLRSVLLLAFLVALAACQRQKLPTGNAEQPADAPQYSVTSNLNGGVTQLPAEGAK